MKFQLNITVFPFQALRGNGRKAVSVHVVYYLGFGPVETRNGCERLWADL